MCIIASLWLGERFSAYDLGAALLCLGAVAMVAQSEDGTAAATDAASPSALPVTSAATRPLLYNASMATEDGDAIDWEGIGAVLITLGSAVTSAFAYTTIRKLKTDPRGLTVDPMVLVLYFAIICVPGGIIGLWLGDEPVPWSELTVIQMLTIVFGCGMLGFVGQTLLNSSFQLESAVS